MSDSLHEDQHSRNPLSEEDPAQATVRERPSISTQATTLTRREDEVAVLVAQGLTNRQIAAELFISEYTVANHVAKILRKLRLGSRSQLTAWVVEQRTLLSFRDERHSPQ